MFIMIFVGAIKASAGTIGAKRTFVIEHVLDETGGRERGLGVLEPLRIKIRFQANQVKLAPPPPPTLSASPHDLDPSHRAPVSSGDDPTPAVGPAAAAHERSLTVR